MRLESNFRELAEKYKSWNGTGVFNKTFRGYSKHDYDPKLVAAWRILPAEAAKAKPVIVLETDTDPMEKIRLGLYSTLQPNIRAHVSTKIFSVALISIVVYLVC